VQLRLQPVEDLLNHMPHSIRVDTCDGVGCPALRFRSRAVDGVGPDVDAHSDGASPN